VVPDGHTEGEVDVGIVEFPVVEEVTASGEVYYYGRAVQVFLDTEKNQTPKPSTRIRNSQILRRIGHMTDIWADNCSLSLASNPPRTLHYLGYRSLAYRYHHDSLRLRPMQPDASPSTVCGSGCVGNLAV
jgi:hypothetical protein